MSAFGWDLPPGCWVSDVDRAAGAFEMDCDRCGGTFMAHDLNEDNLCDECEAEPPETAR